MTTLRAMYSKIRSLSLEQLAVNAVATVMAICWVYQRRRQRKKAGEGRSLSMFGSEMPARSPGSARGSLLRKIGPNL